MVNPGHMSDINDINERYKFIFENCGVSMVFINRELSVVLVNSEFEILTGYKKSVISGKLNVLDIIENENDRKLLEMHLSQDIKVSGSFDQSYDIKMITSNNNKIDVSLHTSMVPESDFILITVIDITSRKIAERTIAESRDEANKLAAIVRHSSEFIGLIDMNGTIIFLNDSGKKLLGVSAEQLDSLYFLDVIPDYLKGIITNEVIPLLMLNRHWEGDLQLINISTGQIKDVHTMAFVLEDPGSGEIKYLANVSLDVTLRKKTEKLLEASEQRLRTITANIPGVVYQFYAKKTGELGINYVSENLKDFFGIELDNANIFEIFLSHIHREDKDRMLLTIKEAVETKSAWDFEGRFLTDNGRVIWFHGLSTPTCNEYGTIFDGLLLDETERKNAEIALRESETHYHSLFDNMLNAFSYCKIIFEDGSPVDLIYLDVNEAFKSLHGFYDVIGKKISEVIPRIEELDKDLFVILGRVALSGKPEKFEIYLNSMNRWYSVAAYSPEKEYIVNIFEDITDRKNSEELLRQSEEKFLKIFMTVPYCLAIFRFRDGQLIDANESFINTIGIPGSNSNITQETDDHYIWSDPSEREYISNEWKASREILYREIQFIDKNGIQRPGIYSLRYISLGNEPCCIFILQDISERIQMEDEHKKLQDQLYQSQKMDAIGQLAGGIAHDFNNILTIIQGNVSMMMLKTVFEDPVYQRLLQIQEQVTRGANLTKQLLGFARGGKYELKTICINDVIRKNIQFFIETRKEIKVDEDLFDGVDPVSADQGQIEQVLLNIFINAAQAMSGGGYLFIQTGNVSFSETDSVSFDLPAGDFVKISIKDTGIGMDRKIMAKIFEPFFTTKSEQGGSGLGLASAYGIIRNHGGAIQVNSEPGRGSMFTIYLPSSDKTVLQENRDNSVKDIFKGEGGILLIDDEPMIMESVSEMLEMTGYTVYRAANGHDAVSSYLLNSDRIDLVVLDMIMPGMSGSEVLKIIKKDNPSAKVILTSGYSMQGEVQKVMNMGCDAFIQKPYNFVDFSKLIHEVIYGKGNR